MAETEHTYKFDVKMTCGGCSGAVQRVLSKTEGVSSFDISLEKQEVVVKGTAPYETVLEKIKKTGKEVRSGTTVTEIETPVVEGVGESGLP